MALFTLAILGSYGGIAYTSIRTSSYNLRNTHCIELAEVGLEELLWSLNSDKSTDGFYTNLWSTRTIVPTSTTDGVSGTWSLSLRR